MAVVSRFFHLGEKRKREKTKKDYLHFINRKHRFDEILEFGDQFALRATKTRVKYFYEKRENLQYGRPKTKNLVVKRTK